jgi:rSAM/selenodomain-associated transferase 1
MKKALLIFAKKPVAGTVKTRLSPPLSAGDAATLYRCMLGDTLDKVAVLRDVEPFLFYQPAEGAEDFFRNRYPRVTLFPQEGTGLGERMENAFGRVLSAGFGAAAAVGTDAPDLPLEYVEQAFRFLAEGRADVVFGPASDGGYYLVAMGRLMPELFRGIPWSTGEVLRESMETAAAAGIRTVTLPLWHDVDTVADLERFRSSGEGAPRTRRFVREIVF